MVPVTLIKPLDRFLVRLGNFKRKDIKYNAGLARAVRAFLLLDLCGECAWLASV